MKKILSFGELMLRLSPPNQELIAQSRSFDAVYTGSEANVAVSLALFGRHAIYFTRVPDNELGRTALGEQRRYGVDTTPCIFGGERLGVFFLETGAGNRSSRILYDRARSGMATIMPGMVDWHAVLEGVHWLHCSGITPAISESAAEVTLEAVVAARNLGLRISCDLNYRAALWRYGKHPSEIMPDIVSRCDVLLGDGDTCNTYFGIQGHSYEEVFEKTLEAFPQLSFMAMTARKAWHATHNAYQGFLHNRQQIFSSREYDIPDIIDRIGAGDAFMAALIHGLIDEPEDLQPVIEFATAAAAIKHAIRGDFNLARAAEVQALVEGNTGGKVNR